MSGALVVPPHPLLALPGDPHRMGALHDSIFSLGSAFPTVSKYLSRFRDLKKRSTLRRYPGSASFGGALERLALSGNFLRLRGGNDATHHVLARGDVISWSKK